MKKFAAFALALFFIVGLIGCSTQSEYSIRIVIPAGSQAEMVYSEEEISPLDNQLTMKSIDVSDGTGVVLKAVETEIEDISTFFTKGEPMISWNALRFAGTPSMLYSEVFPVNTASADPRFVSHFSR